MGFYTRQTVLLFALFDAQDRLSFLCFYTGETSRLWWASVLLLSDPRQSVHTVRVPYQPSVFAPFCFKSAGLALVWASAVLLWFLALLYIFLIDLSIRRIHKDKNIKLCSSWKMADGTYKMPLSVRYVRTIIPFGEELCSLQGGLPRKSTAKLPRSSGPFVEDFAQNGRKCRQGIMWWICLC